MLDVFSQSGFDVFGLRSEHKTTHDSCEHFTPISKYCGFIYHGGNLNLCLRGDSVSHKYPTRVLARHGVHFAVAAMGVWQRGVAPSR